MTYITSRRSLLKSVSLGAGATLLTPFLEQLAAQAAGDEQRVHRKRVIFVMQSNGMNPMHLVPEGLKRRPDGRDERPTNDTLEEISLVNQKLRPAISPLAPFQDRMTVLQGLSGRIALTDHSTNHGALGSYPGNKGPMLQTIDSALSDVLPNTFKHVALGMPADKSSVMNYSYSASAPGTPVPIVCSANLAFQSLFGSVADGSGKLAFDRKTNLLDFMADDVRRVRATIDGSEQAKLDSYLEAFESLHRRQKDLVAKADLLKKHVPQLGDKLTTTTSSLILEAQFEIAATALVAGLTNVVTLTSGNGGQRFGNYPEFGIPDLHHIGHGGSYGDKTYEHCFVELRQFHCRLIAGLATKLANTQEGDGSMLDNSLIVYLSDSAEAHHPRLYEWPVVLLGNLGGSLKTNSRYLQLPTYGAKSHRTMANLYCSLLHATGKPRDKFGVIDPGLKDIDQTGPINELLA